MENTGIPYGPLMSGLQYGYNLDRNIPFVDHIANGAYTKLCEIWGKEQAKVDAAREDEAGKVLDGDFTLWVVVNKWEYDASNHKWFNNYIRELNGVKANHAELYQLYLKSKQKQAITDIMNDDAKDGLYDDKNEKL